MPMIAGDLHVSPKACHKRQPNTIVFLLETVFDIIESLSDLCALQLALCELATLATRKTKESYRTHQQQTPR